MDSTLAALLENRPNRAVQLDTTPRAELCLESLPQCKENVLSFPPSFTLVTSVKLLYKYTLCKVKSVRMQVLPEGTKSSKSLEQNGNY